MSLLRRVAQVCLHGEAKHRGGVPWKGSFWSDGSQKKLDGFIFNETPPPQGQARRWESWEAPVYLTYILVGFACTVGVYAKKDYTIDAWAREKAMKQLKEEGIL